MLDVGFTRHFVSYQRRLAGDEVRESRDKYVRKYEGPWFEVGIREPID